MSTFGEYSRNKKKQISAKGKSFGEYTSEMLGVKPGQTVNSTPNVSQFNTIGDIETVKQTVKAQQIKETTEDERKWFQKGAFEDGYQAGDLIKTILGSDVDVLENISAGFMSIGEKAIDALSWLGTAYQNQALGKSAESEMILKTFQGEKDAADSTLSNYKAMQDENKKGSEEFIKQDLYDEQAIAKKIISDPIKNNFGIDAETDSVFGEKSDEVVQSAGQLAGTMIVDRILPGSGLVLTGVTSFGGEMENALNQGATYDEAAFSAAVTAGAEVLTEKFTGGIKFGGKALDDALTSKITSRISNSVARKIVDMGLDAAGEGFEEVFSGTISAIG